MKFAAWEAPTRFYCLFLLLNRASDVRLLFAFGRSVPLPLSYQRLVASAEPLKTVGVALPDQ